MLQQRIALGTFDVDGKQGRVYITREWLKVISTLGLSSDITALELELAGKADLIHTHVTTDITDYVDPAPTLQSLQDQIDALMVTSVNLTKRIDVISDALTYIGEATVGTAEATSGWTVKKITSAAGELTAIYIGLGAWSDRLTLSYA